MIDRTISKAQMTKMRTMLPFSKCRNIIWRTMRTIRRKWGNKNKLIPDKLHKQFCNSKWLAWILLMDRSQLFNKNNLSTTLATLSTSSTNKEWTMRIKVSISMPTRNCKIFRLWESMHRKVLKIVWWKSMFRKLSRLNTTTEKNFKNSHFNGTIAWINFVWVLLSKSSRCRRTTKDSNSKCNNIWKTTWLCDSIQVRSSSISERSNKY